MAQLNAAGNGRSAAAGAISEAAGRKGPSSDAGEYEHRWWKRFEELEEYKEAHGDCNVPSRWIENPKLANWVHSQRTLYREDKMVLRREYWLTTLGFTWGEPREVNTARAISEAAGLPSQGRKGPSSYAGEREQRWWMRFKELEAYKEAHGDCNVPRYWIENPQLANWVHRQRITLYEGKMVPERERRLRELGFTWAEPREVSWEEMFQNLEAYKEAHGDCNVPQDYAMEGVKFNLGIWVRRQRERYKEGKMDPERERRLRELGLKWKPFDEKWEKKFRLLADFREVHGHCMVPQDCEVQDIKLGHWVNKQRKRYKEGNIDPEREWQLRELGFSFAVMKTWKL